MAKDTQMDDAPVADSASQLDEFIPPSINEPALLAGDTYTYYSPVPASLHPDVGSQTESAPQPEKDAPAPVPCVLGVDEAGRGPVLGPMVYGVFYAPVDTADALLRGQPDVADDPAHRFDDSKVLSAATRAMLLEAVCKQGSALHRSCGWAVAALSARDISAGMYSTTGGGNLNAQALDATVTLIRGVLNRGVRVTDVFVDTVGPPAAYQKKLERFFPGVRITVAKKADSLYPSVSAASVCAKVTRDVALETLYKGYLAAHSASQAGDEPDWGSGYPSDGRCTAWLRRNIHPVFGWGVEECRFSWGTAKDMLEEGKLKGVDVEWPEPEDDDAEGTARMTDFFVTSATQSQKANGGGAAAEEVDELGAWFGRPVGLEAF